MLSFESRTGTITIDLAKCTGCQAFSCIKACSLYGSGILRLGGSLPALRIPLQDSARSCAECLACEVHCHTSGRGAVTIRLPIPGLADLESV